MQFVIIDVFMIKIVVINFCLFFVQNITYINKTKLTKKANKMYSSITCLMNTLRVSVPIQHQVVRHYAVPKRKMIRKPFFVYKPKMKSRYKGNPNPRSVKINFIFYFHFSKQLLIPFQDSRRGTFIRLWEVLWGIFLCFWPTW